MRVPLPAAMMTMSRDMQRSFFRRLIIVAAAVALAIAAGCSALRLTYGQGPKIAYWWLDGYLDFPSAQQPAVHAAINAWFDWHRRTQLPDYAQLLDRARSQVANNVTPRQICSWVGDIRERMDTAFEHALPPLAEVVRRLSREQLAALEHRYDKNDADYAREHLQPDLDLRRREQAKRAVQQAERLYGRIDDEQRRRIALLSAASPFEPEVTLAERRLRQGEVLRTLRDLNAEAADTARARSAVRRLYQDWLSSPRETHRAYQQRLIDYNCTFAAEVHNMTTPLQRKQAAERLEGWAADARALASKPD